MFTLGNKEAICNSNAKFAATLDTVTEKLSIRGFGTFEPSQVTNFFAQRFIAGRNAALSINVPPANELGIDLNAVNVPVVVHIRVNTTRHSSEWAIDFIKRGRPFIFELMVNGSDDDDAIAMKLVKAMKEYELKFNYADNGLPFSYPDPDTFGGDIIDLLLKDPYLSFQKYVDFLPKGQTYGIKAVTTTLVDSGISVTAVNVNVLDVDAITGLLIGDTVAVGTVSSSITAIDAVTPAITVEDGTGFVTGPLLLDQRAQEPNFDGKYLEENVRMSLPSTSDSYGISPDEKPQISGGYSTVTWRMKEVDGSGIDGSWARHKGLGMTRGEMIGEREALFTIYFLEGSDAMNTPAEGGGNAEKVIDFLVSALPEAEGELKLANGTIVSTTAEWLG